MKEALAAGKDHFSILRMGHYSVDSIAVVRTAVVDLDRFWHLSNAANCDLNGDTICPIVACSLGLDLVLGCFGCGRRIGNLFSRTRLGAFLDLSTDSSGKSNTAASARGLTGESP